MTPGEIKSGGRGLAIGYGFASSPFGGVLAAWTARGVCHFAFCVADEAAMLAELAALWPAAALQRDDGQAQVLLRQIFPQAPTRGRVHLVLRGTNFQIKVWEALIRTEPGGVVSYRQLARQLGRPGAARAVGGAVAANTIGFLIPCHRVIREGGEVGQYRWGSERKLALIGWEAATRGTGDGQPEDDARRRWFVLALALSLAGDVFLMLRRDDMFVLGLGSFLLGHVAYIAGFGVHGVWPWIAAVAVVSMVVGQSEPMLRDVQFPWEAGVAGIIAGIIAGVLGGFIPALRAAGIPIATVMRA